MTEPADRGAPAREPADAPPSVGVRVRVAAAPPAAPAPAAAGPLARLAASPITYLITALNIGVFVWAEYFAGGSSNPSTLLRFGAVEPFHVWAGEYWRLVTCMFVHVGLVHVAVNTYMSIGWSTALERALGRGRFLLLYLLAGIGGSCTSVVVGFLHNPHTSAGASGALFGVVGATLALRRRQFADNRSFFADRGVRSIALQFGILTVVGLTVLPFDNAAHVGGLVTGAVLGTLFTAPRARNGWLAFAVAFLALVVGATRPWWSPGEDKDLVAAYARAYLTGNSPGMPDGAWHKNIPRGVRLAEKGCQHRVALACEVLAQHLDRSGDPAQAARADELHRKTCDLDPPLCNLVH
jgi:membrane associated rhomboid family serine protease